MKRFTNQCRTELRVKETQSSKIIHTDGSNITTVDGVYTIFHGDLFIVILSLFIFSITFVTLFNLSGTLFYPAIRITLQSNHFAWWQTVCRESRSMHHSSMYCTQYSVLLNPFTESTDNIFLLLSGKGHIQQARCSLYIEFLWVKIKTLDPDYLSSYRVQYEYTLYSLTCNLSRNRRGAGVANLVGTVPPPPYHCVV